MASLQECEAALQALATRLAAVDPDLRRKHAVDRTVSCRVVDLGVVFHVRLTDGSVVDLHCRPDHEPTRARPRCASRRRATTSSRSSAAT